jgi:Fe-S oxidoreductase
VLGPDEKCCGESVRRIGDQGTFSALAESNRALFARHGVSQVLVLSPHCFHTFSHEYENGTGALRVQHVSQLLANLIHFGKLNPAKPVSAIATYHDPCYLGRHNDVFDAPREVLRAIPGLTFREMFRNGKNSLCCGGGGGRMWMETKFGERFSDLRVPEALAVGADVLATACPYCISMFEDAKTALGLDSIQVLDVAEVVSQALQEG